MIASLIPLLFLLIPSQSYGGFEFPQNLNSADREKTLNVFGLNTSSKFLSPSFPLGGYSGLEISTTVETFDVGSISLLGSGSLNRDTATYPKITIGKGVYNDSDIFFEFVPYLESSKTSRYGMQFRWGFYQAKFFPISLSLLVHANSANLSNKLTTRTVGSDILLGFMVGRLSLHMGAGWTQSSGDFTGGNEGITDSLIQETERVASAHWALGGTYLWDIYLIGASVDQFTETVYSFKLGVIF